MRQLQNRVTRLEQRVGVGGQHVRVLFRRPDTPAGEIETARQAATRGGLLLVVSFVAPGAARVPT